MPFTKTLATEEECPKCREKGAKTVMVCQMWESADEAHEDFKYTCPVCSFYYWVDGADA